MKAEKLAKKVGKAIARERKQAKMTQAQVARALEIETETVSRLETGAISATLERLDQFSQLFECPVEVFLQEADDGVNDMAKKLARLLYYLEAEERNVLYQFVSETVKLFKKRK